MDDAYESEGSGLNRRQFLKAAGIGAGVLATPGMVMAANKLTSDVSTINQKENVTDILVIGGGFAGIMAATTAVEKGMKVTLIEKGRIFKSGLSPFAGGFGYFNPKTDNTDTIWKGSSKIGNYLANKDYYDMWVDESENAYKMLDSWGFFSGTKEYRNIARQRVIDSGVNVIERTMVTNLIKQDGRIAGAIGFSIDGEELVVVKAKAVILCSGAGAFKTSGYYTNSITSDGDSMAYRIGAEISGKEFNDTHWTHWVDPAASNLNWLDHVHGSMGVLDHAEIDGNLNLGFPIMAHVDMPPVYMGPPAGARPEEPPQGQGSKEKGGRPMTPPGCRDVKLPIVGGASAGLSVHKAEGLFPNDAKCASNIPGLYGAGDALSSMMCGALYSIGAGSTSGSAVQGTVAAKSAAAYALTVKQAKVKASDLERMKKEILAPRMSEKGYSPEWVTQVLQGIMIPYYVLYVKTENRLQAALTNVEFLRDQFASNLLANNTHELRQAHETRNMILNAEMKLRTSLFRKESRGNHYREDFPARDDKTWLAWIKLKNEGDSMKLTRVPVPKEWLPADSVTYEQRYSSSYPGEKEFRAKM